MLPKSGKVGNRKHIKTEKEEFLDAAVIKWYCRNAPMARYWQLQESLLLTLAFAILSAVKGSFGDSETVTDCLAKFFM